MLEPKSQSPKPLAPNLWTKFDWQVLFALTVLAFAFFLAGLNCFGILDPSDAYYSEGAREMLESNDWLVPKLNYAWFFDKPIMNYWLIALSYRAFGVSEFAARLPAAFCGALLVPGLYLLARQFLRRRTAILSSLILLSSPMWLTLGHMSLTDMPLSFFIWVALGSLFIAYEKGKSKVVWIAYVALGFGLLTKGPLAIFIVGMNFSLYLLSKRLTVGEIFKIVQKMYVLPGLLLSLAIAIPWYQMVNAKTHGVFFQEFFLNQNLNRAMGAVDHRAGPFYYWPLVLGAAFPWTLFLLFSASTWFRSWWKFINCRRTNLQELATSSSPWSLESLLNAFAVTCAFAPFIFFSMLPTKLATYILPVLPALALLSSISFEKVLRLRHRFRAQLTLIGSLMAAVSVSSLIILSISLKAPQLFLNLSGTKLFGVLQSFCQNTDANLRFILAVSFMLLGGASIFLLILPFSRKLFVYKWFIGLVLGCVLIAVPSVITLSYQEKCRDMQLLAQYAKTSSHADLVMLGRRSYSAAFYMKRRVTFLPGEKQLADFIESTDIHPDHCIYLLHESVFSSIRKKFSGLEVVKRAGGWTLSQKTNTKD